VLLFGSFKDVGNVGIVQIVRSEERHLLALHPNPSKPHRRFSTMPLAGPRRQATAASPRFTLISSAPSASDRFHGNPGGHDSAIPLGFHWLATLSHRPAWEGGGASNKTGTNGGIHPDQTAPCGAVLLRRPTLEVGQYSTGVDKPAGAKRRPSGGGLRLLRWTDTGDFVPVRRKE